MTGDFGLRSALRWTMRQKRPIACTIRQMLVIMVLFGFISGCQSPMEPARRGEAFEGMVEIRGRLHIDGKAGEIYIVEIPKQQLDAIKTQAVQDAMNSTTADSWKSANEEDTHGLASSTYIEIQKNGEVVMFSTAASAYLKNHQKWELYQDGFIIDLVKDWVKNGKIRCAVAAIPPPK